MNFVRLSPKDFFDAIESSKEKSILIDVRTIAEYQESHLLNAINIPVSDIPQKRGQLKEYTSIFLYCHSGGRSQLAVSLLDDLKDSTMIDLEGGISAWSEEGFLIVKE